MAFSLPLPSIHTSVILAARIFLVIHFLGMISIISTLFCSLSSSSHSRQPTVKDKWKQKAIADGSTTGIYILTHRRYPLQSWGAYKSPKGREEITECCCGDTHRPVLVKNDASTCSALQRNLRSWENTKPHVALLHKSGLDYVHYSKADIKAKFLDGIIRHVQIR